MCPQKISHQYKSRFVLFRNLFNLEAIVSKQTPCEKTREISDLVLCTRKLFKELKQYDCMNQNSIENNTFSVTSKYCYVEKLLFLENK